MRLTAPVAQMFQQIGFEYVRRHNFHLSTRPVLIHYDIVECIASAHAMR